MSTVFTPQPTPNPRAYKFVADREIQPGPSRAYYDSTEAAVDPVASRLFTLPGVTGVFILGNFCSVTQDGSREWAELGPQIQAVLAEAFD